MVANSSIIIRTVNNGQDYTGIKLSNNDKEPTEIIIPNYYMQEISKTIDSLTKEEKNKLKKLVKAWSKYQSKLRTANNGLGDNHASNFNFNVVFKLIQDFLENGLYIEFEHIEKMRSVGKINFPRTVKKCTPVILDENPLYLPYVTKVKKISDENMVRSAQILVLNDITKKIGWLLGFNIYIPLTNIRLSLDKSLVYKLKLIRNNSFNTRKLRLIDLVIQYITMLGLSSDENNKLFVSTVYSFWEEMISDIIGNVSDSNLRRVFYIRHRYINKKDGRICKILGKKELHPLMPDAVYMSDNNVTILDAKYYTKPYLPVNDDITKQFAYMRKAYAYFGENYNYRNIFVLPTEDISFNADVVAVFDIDIRVPRNQDLIPIEVLYLNVDYVVESYISGINISNSVL